MEKARKRLVKLSVFFALLALIVLSAVTAFVSFGVEDENADVPGTITDTVSETSDGEVNPNPIVTTEDGFKLQLSVNGTYYSVVGYAAGAKNIVIPLNYKGIPIKRIDNSAFLNKKTIEHVTLNEQIEYIGEGAFDGCDNLEFNVDAGGRYIGTPDNACYYFYKPQNIDTVKNFTVNMNTALVAAYAFSSCPQIENVVIPESVKDIGYKAIGSSDTLKSVTLPFVGEKGDGETNWHLGYVFGARTLGGTVSFAPKNLKEVTITSGDKIAKNSFYGIDMIESLTLPYLGESATDTNNCIIGYIYGADRYIENVNIPVSIKNITVNGGYVSNNVFYGCARIENVSLNDVICKSGELCGYCGCDNLISATIPNGVKSIGGSAFSGCSNLTSIEIPNSVTSIGQGAFYDCSSLKNIEIPDSVTSIGSYAFYNCSRLTSMNLPNSLTRIGSDTFDDCYSLTSIYIPSSVTSIENSAFINCDSLVFIKNMSDISLTLGSADNGNIAQDALVIEDKNGNKIYRNSGSIVINDFLFDVNSSGEYVLRAYLGSEDTVILPENVNGHAYAISNMRGVKNVILPNNFTSIGDNAFRSCRSLTNIEIPNSVMSIGSYAFYDCSRLTSIEIPNSVASIENSAFKACGNLASIIIGNGVRSIGSNAFEGCDSLTSIEIPSSVTSIGGGAFPKNITQFVLESGNESYDYIDGVLYNKEKTRIVTVVVEHDEIIIPNTVTNIASSFKDCTLIKKVSFENGSSLIRIGDEAFSGCRSLTNIEIPNSVTSIGNDAFYNCSSITSIEIPSSVTSIESRAFFNCSGLSRVELPNSVTSIWDNAFAYCSCLINIKIPDSVTSIGMNAFRGCTSLTSIEIPNSVTNIEGGAFSKCPGLTIIAVASGNIKYHSDGNSIIDTERKSLIVGCKNSSIPTNGSVTRLGEHAFDGCTNLTSIEIPNTITSIEQRAFYECSSLTSMDIPNTVTSIGSDAFRGCINLTNIKIPTGVTSIGSEAFLNCDLVFIKNMSDISLTFGSADNGYLAYHAQVIEDKNGNKTYRNTGSVVINDFLFDVNNSGEYILRAYLGSEDTVILPENVNGYTYVISNMRGVKNVIISNSLMSIDGSAFYGCDSLTSITIPNSVTSIGSYAFAYCDSLTSITIPNSVTSIGNYAFAYCDSLTSITIGSDVTSVGSGVFSNCPGLTSIVVASGNTKYHSEGNCLIETSSNKLIVGCKNSIIPTDGSVTSIGGSAFSGCSSLTSIEIPNSVTSIGGNAFYCCHSLTSIIIPNSVTSIWDSAFDGCSKLTRITLPNSLRSIESQVFNRCSKLKEITFSGERHEWRHVTKASDWDDGITYTMNFAPDSGGMYETNGDISEFYLAGYNGSSGTLNVKEIYSGRPVTEVFPYGLYNNTSLCEVYLPDSIKKIGEYAFAGSGLTDFTMPESVTQVELGAFANTTMPSMNLTFIGQSQEDNTYLGWIFGAEDFTLNSIYVPETLKTVNFSQSNKISNYAFYGCDNILEFNLLGDTTEIGDYAFYDCLSLPSIDLPDTVTTIGNHAFAGCRALTEFAFPNSVTKVGESVLHGDNNINSITIGTGLVGSNIADYINNNPLFGLDKSSSSLERYIVAPDNTEFMTDEYGVLYLKLNLALSGAENNVPVAVVDAPALSNLSNYTLPQYIVEVMPYAFAYNSTLKTIELEYVRRIGNNSFMECDKLINVIFSNPEYDTPERLREYIGHKTYSQLIEPRAFMGCISLMKADLDVSTIVEVGEEAFLDCNRLKTVVLGDRVRKLGGRAFGSSDVGGSTLECIEVVDGNPYFIGIDGVLFAKNDDGTLTLNLYPACKPTYVDGEIQYINGETQYATEYSLPETDGKGNSISVSGIESYAFSNAVYLDDLVVDPKNELRVGDYAFADSMIQHISIGENVTSLGLRRGEGEYTVFSGDRYLTDIEVSADNPYYSSVSGVLFDKEATRLIKYPAAKVGREYIIPASVNTIASMAFKDNKNIGIVTVRSDLYVVGLEAFYGCSNLQVVYFNHVYAPRAIMENAFTVNTSVNAEESQAALGYSPSYYEDFGDGYGWKNYDGVYNTTAYDVAPVYESQHGVSVYYAVVVVDSSGRPIDGTWVAITDYNGNTETVEALKGIATFWSYANTDENTFAITFDHKYKIKVYDGEELYFQYINDEVYLDGKTLATIITLEKNMAAFALLQPSIAGVSCNDKEINSESVEINKAEFDYDGMELIDESLGYSASNVRYTGTVHESIGISVIAYFNNEHKEGVGNNCVLMQNGTPIPDCELVGTEIRDGSATYTFSVPVYRLIPETPITSKFTMTIKNEELVADTILNIDIIDFSISQDDIDLETDDVTMDLSAMDDTIIKLLGGRSMNFNISKNIKAYIDIEDSTITVGLKGNWKKSKNKNSSLDPQTGYEQNKMPHNKGSYFYQRYATVTENRDIGAGIIKKIKHKLTYNIRYYKDPNIEDFYYYRMYIYEDKWENNIATLYGKVNGGSVLSEFGFPDNSGKIGRERVAQKAQIAYLGHYSKLLKDLKDKKTKNDKEFKDLVAKGYVYTENEKADKYQSSTSNTFSVALGGELVFKYDRDQGLHLVSGAVTGEAGYVMQHKAQFAVWVIPFTLDVNVDLNGKVKLNVVVDKNRTITMDDAKLTVSLNITASLGVGCSLASAGVTGGVGNVFVIDFYPDFGVESWSINGRIGVYGKILWWRKEWTLWEGSHDIVRSQNSKKMAQRMNSMYLASSYERLTPDGLSEESTLFTVGSDLYKVYYTNAFGREGYDENNFVKLAVAKWMGSDWSDGVIIDDNGRNDADYRIFNDNGLIRLIYSQSAAAKNTGLDDIYNDASNIVIKTADIVGGHAQNVSTVATSTSNYSYLHQISVVGSVPTAVWVENADNNVFGVSPHNYIDANGESHVYATTANSVWMSRLESGAWTSPVCLKDGLSAITNLVLTTSGDVYYIEDTNGDLADTDDRMLYGKRSAEFDFAAISSPLVSVTNAYADGDYMVYRAVAIGDDEGVSAGLYKIKNSSTEATLVMPEETVEQMPDNFKPVTDESGNAFAYVYYDNETWENNGADATGSALYGIFYDGGWSKPVKLVEEKDDEYITSFSVYKNAVDQLAVTVDYTDGESTRAWSTTQHVMLEEKVTLVGYELDYKEQILYVTVVNNGASSSGISATVDGVESVLTNKLSGGTTETFGIRITDNKLPVVKLSASSRVFGTIKGVDFNYADFAVYSKQIVVGGKNILLVAVRNNGNTASDGELFIKPGTDISDIEMVGKRIVLPNISVGGIYYLEFALDDILSADSDVVAIFAKSSASEPVESLLSDNACYATYNVCTLAVEDVPQTPKLSNSYIERLESDTDSCIVEFNDCPYYIAHVYNGKTTLTGMEYTINEETRQLELSASYIDTLTSGDYLFKVEFVGVDGNYICEFTLKIYAEYDITWFVDNGVDISNIVHTVKEDDIPSFASVPTHVDDVGYTYEFTGWDADGDGVADKISSAVADTTYVALFRRTPKEFTVTWKIDSMDFVEQYSYGSYPIFMGKVNKDGYDFVGWDTDGDGATDSVNSVTTDASYLALYEEIPVHDVHTPGEWIVDVEATCTAGGHRYKECTVCGELVEEENTTKLNHEYGEWIIDLEASCSQTGLKHRVCTTCNEATEKETIDKLAHTLGEWIVDASADCTHKGSRHKECSVCEAITNVEEISMTEHSYGEEQTKAVTCTEDGYTYKKCSVCGHEDKLTTITAHGHTVSEWLVDTEAAAGVTGYHHKECTECGEIVDSESIEALPTNNSSTLTTAIVIAIVSGIIGVATLTVLIVSAVKKKKRA